MKKLRYYLARLFTMNYGQMIRAAKTVHKRSGKATVAVFFDMIVCSVKYLAGYMDYLVFDFETLSDDQRATFITRGVNNGYIAKMNDPAYSHCFHDKTEFNEIFSDCIGRAWMRLDRESPESFAAFARRLGTLIAKPIDALCGKDIEKLTVTEETDCTALYARLVANGQLLVEEYVVQCETMRRLFPNAVNTVRLVTCHRDGKSTVMFRALRIGNGENVVDNFNHGGMYTVIEEDGTIRYPAIDKAGNVYERHPQTGTEIVGFRIPDFETVEALALRASARIPEVGLVGWDVAVTEHGPLLIEGNQVPGHDIYQSRVHLGPERIGKKPFFDRVIYGKE